MPDQAWWDHHAPLVGGPPDADPGPGTPGPRQPWEEAHLLPGHDLPGGPIQLHDLTGYDPALFETTPRPNRPAWLTALVAGAIAAVAALAGAWSLGAFDRPPPPSAAPTTPVVRPTINVSGVGAEVATAVALKVTPSIVAVEVGDGDFGRNFVPFVGGSGVVIDDRLIVTNNHVIQEGDSVQIVLQDGSIHPATVLGSDADTDIAVLQVDVDGLVPVEVGNTDDLTIGETAIAIGNPLGLSGGASLTVGVLSAFGRQIDTDIDSALFGMLQTDAPITEGSSGGALVDGAGRLIGITTAIGVGSTGAEGIGFAVPVELMRRITDEIIATGEVRHAYLGIELRNELNEREDGALVPAGAVISAFSSDARSVAEEAGMERGDVIVALNGQAITTREALIGDLRMLAAGDVATVEAIRDGELLVFEIELARRPPVP